MSNTTALQYAKDVAHGIKTWQEVEPVDDGDHFGVFHSWLQGVLDYELTYTSQKTLKSVRLLVAYGGPNCWITFDGRDTAVVEASWYSDIQTVISAPCSETAELSELVMSYFEETVWLTS